MHYVPTTPFGQRPVSAGLLATRALAARSPARPEVDKWQVFHDLRVARDRFAVTDRDLTVLNALLSFLPDRGLKDGAPLVVFPSNASLSDRAHGMAESTLRRHLAALVRAGLICRNDSPNGKRYAARDRSGEVLHSYGFDLRPLLVLAAEIAEAAQDIEATARRLHMAREAVVLKLRDAGKLVAYGADQGLSGEWEALTLSLVPVRKALRRKLSAADVADLDTQISQILDCAQALLSVNDAPVTEEVSVNGAHSGRHYTNSNADSYVSEPCLEKGRAADRAGSNGQAAPNLPLALVLKACPDIQPYAKGEMAHWHELVATAGFVRGMMGISQDAWDDAQRNMGRETAAIVVAAMLQRVDAIRKPGGYLRALSEKARDGSFSAGPMVMALLNAPEKSAA